MKLCDILKEGREDFLPNRSKQAYELKRSGMYFKDIARELGVSNARAAQLVKSYHNHMSHSSELYDILPPGIVNELRGIWGNIETIDELRDLVNNGGLESLPKFGPKKAAIINQWLTDNPPNPS